MPEPSAALHEDVGRLQAWGCIDDGDPLVDYLAEIERYRAYICGLRDEENCE